MTDKIVVLNACDSASEAERLARMLIEQKLAACVTLISPVRSFYRWNGAITDAQEWLLVIKSSQPLFDRLRAAIQSAHSYELPEILALPVSAGLPAYLSWLESELLTDN